MIIYYTDGFESSREESHRLLEKALAAYTGDEKKAKKLIGSLKKGEHGKPYIEGFCCFSISHTGSIWAVLIADRECGLDIQLGRNCDNGLLIATDTPEQIRQNEFVQNAYFGGGDK